MGKRGRNVPFSRQHYGLLMMAKTLDIFIPSRSAIMSIAFPEAWSLFTSFSMGDAMLPDPLLVFIKYYK